MINPQIRGALVPIEFYGGTKFGRKMVCVVGAELVYGECHADMLRYVELFVQASLAGP